MKRVSRDRRPADVVVAPAPVVAAPAAARAARAQGAEARAAARAAQGRRVFTETAVPELSAGAAAGRAEPAEGPRAARAAEALAGPEDRLPPSPAPRPRSLDFGSFDADKGGGLFDAAPPQPKARRTRDARVNPLSETGPRQLPDLARPGPPEQPPEVAGARAAPPAAAAVRGGAAPGPRRPPATAKKGEPPAALQVAHGERRQHADERVERGPARPEGRRRRARLFEGRRRLARAEF